MDKVMMRRRRIAKAKASGKSVENSRCKKCGAKRVGIEPTGSTTNQILICVGVLLTGFFACIAWHMFNSLKEKGGLPPIKDGILRLDIIIQLHRAALRPKVVDAFD